MIEYLRIRDLGVIEEAALELGPGLVAITGETGAGKTMIMSALDLLFGGKPNPAQIRHGAQRAEVEAGLAVDPTSATLPDVAADVEDGTLIIGRSLRAQRSRAWLAGRGVPAGLLAELGDELVVRHGQNDQRRLANAGFRRRLLDRYAGAAAAAALDAQRAAFDHHRAAGEALAGVLRSDRESAQRADLLRHGLAEIESFAPEPEEDTSLRSEAQRLMNIGQVRESVAAAYEALRGADGFAAESGVATAHQALASAAQHDEALQPWLDLLQETQTLLGEAAGGLEAYLSDLDADPARLDWVQQRLAALRTLQRKYGDTVTDILAWGAAAAQELDALDTSAERIDQLQAAEQQAAAALSEASAALSGVRQAAAQRLSAAVTAELSALALPDASIDVQVSQPPDEAGLQLSDGRRVAVRRDGSDEVALRFVPHPGAPALPIGEAASGGELSRVMLALEVALAGANPVPVFVFDEVDAGIGGRAAVEVGRRLAALGRTAQVLVVTHLPQVAAFADQHIVVSKSPAGGVTASSVVVLDAAEQQAELARMLSGLEESATAVAHAAELIDLAERERASAPELRTP